MRASILLTAAAALVTLSATAATTQESRSAQAAKALTDILDARGMDAIATKDPDNPGRFIGALYFRGAQLLVVGAEYAVPVLLEQRIAKGEYRETYLDLQGASEVKGRLFVQDLLADGLRPPRHDGDPFDIVYESGQTYGAFNGDWAGQKLSEQEYKARFAAADERYARMLTALAAALKPGT
jgi:hypothetical protein